MLGEYWKRGIHILTNIYAPHPQVATSASGLQQWVQRSLRSLLNLCCSLFWGCSSVCVPRTSLAVFSWKIQPLLQLPLGLFWCFLGAVMNQHLTEAFHTPSCPVLATGEFTWAGAQSEVDWLHSRVAEPHKIWGNFWLLYRRKGTKACMTVIKLVFWFVLFCDTFCICKICNTILEGKLNQGPVVILLYVNQNTINMLHYCSDTNWTAAFTQATATLRLAVSRVK